MSVNLKMKDKKENKSILETLGNSQIWKSIIRSGIPHTRRQRMHAVLGSVFLHLHPARLPKHAVKVGYTWCMGGLSFFLFVNLTITGILLMFYYRPTVEYAYTDIIDLTEQVPLGIMRELHRWAASCDGFSCLATYVASIHDRIIQTTKRI